MKKIDSIAILVGGGPAPGINGVIAAATIEAINRGIKVWGIQKGFSGLARGKSEVIEALSIEDVSRIHTEGGSILGTSRDNPMKMENGIKSSLAVLKQKGIQALITIGGDDTAYSAMEMARHAAGELAVIHVPKTIDNDLPLPHKMSTFGFQTARAVGTEIVQTLMVDAKTTERWYLVVTMGRKAGHLALGIGISAGTTLTLIPEDFGHHATDIMRIRDIIVGTIIKRAALGRQYGVVVLAEGLAEIVKADSLPTLEGIERDPHGNLRFSEVDFDRILQTLVRDRLKELAVGPRVIGKTIGYELRCCPPNPFDREYTRELGFGAVQSLLDGASGAMIVKDGDTLKKLEFEQIRDVETGKTKIRLVDINSIEYQVAQKYMILLTKQDLEDAAFCQAVAKVTNLAANKVAATLLSSVK